MAKITDQAKNKKSKKLKNNKSKRMVVYGTVVGLFFVCLFGVYQYVNTYKQEVEVVGFSEKMVAGTLVEESLMNTVEVSQNNFQEGMVKWKDREEYIGKYTGHFIRSGVATYKDMYVEDKPVKTPYLYNLESDQEVLTFPYQIGEAGGKLVQPGDRLRIRGSYTDPGKDPESAEDDKIVTDVIFDVVQVQDLLNGSNESIVDVINEASRLPQSDRETLMKSAEFRNQVTPRAILMVVNSEDIEKYVEFQANEDPKYTITLLSRNEELKNEELNTGNSVLQMLEDVKDNQAVVDGE